MAVKNPIRPLSEAPLLTSGLVGDMPVGRIVLAEHAQKTVLYSAKKKSRLSLDLIIETARGAELVVEGVLDVEEGATVAQVVVIRGEGKVTLRQAVRIHRDGELRRTVMIDGAGDANVAIDDDIVLAEPGARCVVDVRGVLRDSARSTARGRIVIERAAVRATANMQLHHLLLGEKAFASAVPELAVHVDDVSCRHAASISRPPSKAMNYLASRGLTPEAANAMLADAFLCPAGLL